MKLEVRKRLICMIKFMGLIHLIVATVSKCRETVRSCSLCATPLIAEKMYKR